MRGTPTPGLPARIRALRLMSGGELRQLYEALLGRRTASNNRPWLVTSLVESLARGAEVAGKDARRAIRRAIEEAHKPRRCPAPPSRDPRIPPVGSTIHRSYCGRDIEVQVTAAGLRYEGRLYTSLSAIAREVTGAHWNGLLWFGLTRRSRSHERRGSTP